MFMSQLHPFPSLNVAPINGGHIGLPSALTFNTGTADGQFTNAATSVDIPTDGPAGTSHPISVLSDMKIEDHQTFTAILGARTNADTDYNRDPDDAVVFEATCSSLAVTILDDDTGKCSSHWGGKPGSSL